MPRRLIESAMCSATTDEHQNFCDRFLVSPRYGSLLPSSDQTALDAPPGYVVVYLSLFSSCNFCIPLNPFISEVLNYYGIPLSSLDPFGGACITSFVVACKSLGGDASLPLFSFFIPVRSKDWVNFARRTRFPDLPLSVNVPQWMYKFVFIREDFVADQGLLPVVPFCCGLVFPFALPSEGVLGSGLYQRLSGFAYSIRPFPDAVLFMSGLAPCWEGFPARPSIYANGKAISLCDYLGYIGSDIAFAPAPEGSSFPIADPAAVLHTRATKGKEPMVESSKRRRVEPSVSDAVREFLAHADESADNDPFIPDSNEVDEARGVLESCVHSEYSRRLDGLSVLELANFHDVAALKLALSGALLSKDVRNLHRRVIGLQNDVSAMRTERSEHLYQLQQMSAENAILKDEVRKLKELNSNESHEEVNGLRAKVRSYDEREHVFLATEAGLRSELKVLKEEFEFAKLDRSLMVIDLLPHVVRRIFSSSSFLSVLGGFYQKAVSLGQFQACKELLKKGVNFDPRLVQGYDESADVSFDRALNDFDSVEFPYLDLLASRSGSSLAELKSLDPSAPSTFTGSQAGPSTAH